ncbi:MAG: transcriptional regulator, TetR family [Frankiales bacterium]|nr:transcriptional regulator, TetR family [Frankiales bacterium]
MTEPPATLEDRRRHVVEIAAQVLATDGPHGLSLRRIATLAGGSTQLVYTLFGGKPGLGDALYAEGFRRLAASMSTAVDVAPPPGDPERLLALGRGYRAFALAEPAFFSVMFGRAIPGFTPARPTRAAGRAATFGQVVTAARECLAAGTLVADDAEELARACWVTAHGLAALEVSGLLAVDDVDAFADVVLRAPVEAHRAR